MKKTNNLIKILFSIYILLIIFIVILKFEGTFDELFSRINQAKADNYRPVNLELFRTIKLQIRCLPSNWSVTNLVGNVILFVPFGILFPTAFKRLSNFFIVFFVGLFAIFAIETSQYIWYLGTFDVDDILLNAIGLVIGYIFWAVFSSLKKVKKN